MNKQLALKRSRSTVPNLRTTFKISRRKARPNNTPITKNPRLPVGMLLRVAITPNRGTVIQPPVTPGVFAGLTSGLVTFVAPFNSRCLSSAG